jgi:PST family polysaccharide transporter
MFIYSTQSWIHLSIGRADRWLRWTIFELAVTGLLFLLGLRWGPAGIALAWTASFWILTIPALWYAGKPVHFGIGPVLAAVWKYVLASLAAGCGATVIIRLLPAFVEASGWIGAAVRIAAVSSLFSVLYIAAVVLLYRGCSPLYQVARLLREMTPWGGFSTPSLAVTSTGVAGQSNVVP